eukprot:gene433-434_t
MHLSSFAVNKHIASRLGLKEITLNDLGPLVVLVGENGCGKTRLLEAVDWLLRRTRHVGFDRLSGLRKGRAKKQEFYDALAIEPPDDHYTFAAAGDDVEAYNALLSPFEGFELAVESGESVDGSLSTYCALSDILRNSLSSNREHFARLAIGVPRGDDETDPILVGSPLAYIDDVCMRQASERDHETIGFHSPNNAAPRDYARLRKLFSDLAGMVLDIANGHGSLDGRSIRSTSFSDGQIALFRIVVLLHSRVLDNAAIPILLDEPERHLHPSRLIGLVDALREYLPNAQLWIATHSLALTAHLAAVQPRAIWFGANGHFERAGLAQEKVVNGLLGGPAGAEQISDFCVRADQFAACAFSADCLSPPETATYRTGDPQIQQIHDFFAFAGATRPSHSEVEGIRMNAKKLLLRLFELVAPARRLQVFSGDSLPPRLPFRALVLARDDDDWCIGMRCPCGCGTKIELLLIKEAAPRWDLGLDEKVRNSIEQPCLSSVAT